MKESMKPDFIRVDDAIKELEKVGLSLTVGQIQRMCGEGKIHLYFRAYSEDDSEYLEPTNYPYEHPHQYDDKGKFVIYYLGFCEVIAQNPIGSDIEKYKDGLLPLMDDRVFEQSFDVRKKASHDYFDVSESEPGEIWAMDDDYEYSFERPNNIEKHLYLTPADFQKLKPEYTADNFDINITAHEKITNEVEEVKDASMTPQQVKLLNNRSEVGNALDEHCKKKGVDVMVELSRNPGQTPLAKELQDELQFMGVYLGWQSISNHLKAIKQERETGK